MDHPSLADVERAAARLAGGVRRTPALSSPPLAAQFGPRTELFFKCENLQLTGSFKLRGASNAVRSLSESEAARGVATHSSGNHGTALAAAAADRGIPSYVVVPEGAVAAKVAAIATQGGELIRCAPTQRAREEGLEAVLSRTGATMIHPYDDARIVAGQGTTALEFLSDVPGLEVLIVPVGGGGLISGCAIVARALQPGIEVIGAEPAGADDTARSLAAGAIVGEFTPETVADGLRAKIGTLNFRIVSELVDQVVTVSDEATLGAMRDLWASLKLVVEPSAATVLAAARAIAPRLAGRRVGLVLSGGNVDLDHIGFCRRCRA